MSLAVPVIVEACVTSGAEAVTAGRAGADRLELCRDLDVGGLTPPGELVDEIVRRVDLPVFGMVRPRGGDFRAREGDVDRMLRAMDDLRRSGVAGLVAGLLDRHHRIDREAVADLVAAADDLPVTFHRAFDQTRDPDAALEALADLGVARVLTGGGPGRAWEGRVRLEGLVRRAGNRVVIVAGGRVRGDHVVDLVRATGAREVHARAEGVAGLVEALRGRRA